MANYGSDYKSYTIPVGQFYQINPIKLFFVADHDGGSRNGNSFFRNVRLYELGECGTAQMPENTPTLDYIHVFPNPAQDVININMSDITDDSNYVIFNLLGEQIKSDEINQKNFTIDVSNFVAGSYFIQIKTKQLVMKRFTVH